MIKPIIETTVYGILIGAIVFGLLIIGELIEKGLFWTEEWFRLLIFLKNNTIIYDDCSILMIVKGMLSIKYSKILNKYYKKLSSYSINILIWILNI